MAVRIVGGVDPNVVQGAIPAAASAAALVQGIFVGLNGSGELVPASSSGGPVALGALYMGAQQKDAKGNVLFVHPKLGYCPNDGIRIDGFTGLTPGNKYYLSSGGGIAASGSQVVGIAESSTLLIQKLGDLA